jgi:hypothetical protein
MMALVARVFTLPLYIFLSLGNTTCTLTSSLLWSMKYNFSLWVTDNATHSFPIFYVYSYCYVKPLHG